MKKTDSPKLQFRPTSSIIFVSKTNTENLAPDKIQLDRIGHKAFGLACLPKSWSLPFICISEELFLNYCHNKDLDKCNNLLEDWAKRIVIAASLSGISSSATIIIRSSGKSENIDERGKFHSTKGALEDLLMVLKECLSTLAADNELCALSIPLVLQEHCNPNYANGHLSNERRWSKENRDWVVEYEKFELKASNNSYQINLRNWREKLDVNSLINKPLSCKISPLISKALKIAAAWAYELKIRVHFEWCWDGAKVILVQADLEHDSIGIDPTKTQKPNRVLSKNFIPKCLKEISQSDIQYNKIKNVFIYLKLNLIDKSNLYILNDQEIIRKLAKGENIDLLTEDIRELVKDSLVIRMDIDTDDKKKRQLLPRTNEVRDLEVAMNWLKNESRKFFKSSIDQENVVFIFHNFIPSISSAFAYAAPGKRNVQIESLWGIPDGLYYNAHDKYAVDTGTPQIKNISPENIKNFKVVPKHNSKRFIIAPDESGRWTSKTVKPSYYWHSSIKPQSLVKQIAYESRLIVEEVGEPLSIMWFIGIPKTIYSKPILPWYHETFDPIIMNRAQTKRKKKIFDESFLIRKTTDLDKLRLESKKSFSKIRRIRIQPCEDKLLRDKETLKTIGEIAKEINAVILLEGGILSHAYYQLLTTEAIVEIIHPFSSVEGKQEFNKLVRDKIPQKIEVGGEIVKTTILTGEELLKALKEKLIEESFEVVDAIDQEQIIGEVADVREVIDSILAQLNVSKTKLKQCQNQKRKKAGSFKEGFVLIETKNPLPQNPVTNEESLFENIFPKPAPTMTKQPNVSKWNDRRDFKNQKATLLTLEIPSVNTTWTSDLPKIPVKLDSDLEIQISGSINGSRTGSKLTINLSINVPDIQLKLL